MALDGNERRALYRNLINDPATQAETRKYSFVDWEKKLLGDEKAIGKLAKYSVGRNWAIDENDFTERYAPEFKSTPAPKQQAASVAVPVAAPVEQQAYTPPPQPAVGSPEYDKQLQAQYGGMKPTLGATFGGAPAAFETKEQKKQEQISPVFKAQKLAYQDVPIAEEQRESQRQFAKATKEQQQAALIGSTGAELKKARQAEREGPGDRASANVEALWEGAKNAGINIFNGLKTVMNTAALNETPMDEGEREYYQQEQWGEMYRASKEAGENLQNELYRLNVSPDVLNAIDKGDYGKIPEATLQTIGNVGISAISSLLTAGGSMYFQTLPDTYREGVEAIAREKGITPEEVIRSGEDAKITAQTTAGIIAALERAGAGRLSKSIANKGGYKAVRDFLIRNGFSKPVGRLGGLGYAGSGEFITEYGQQGAQQLGKIVAASEDASQFYQKLPKEFLSKEAFKERLGAGVAGFVGGAGVVGIGRGSARTFGSGVSLDKFSDNIANNEIIQNAARGYEDNIARAEEQGRKPEAYNQKQLKKILNDPEAWVREEIKYLKQTIESNKNLGLDSKVEENSMAKATSLLTQIKEEKKAIEEADIASAQTPAATQEEAQAVPTEEVQGTGRRIVVDSIEEVPAEYRDKVIEVSGPLGRFGIGKKQYAYTVPMETMEATAPEVATEEDLAEDIPFEEVSPVTDDELAFLDEMRLTPEEEAAPVAQAEEVAPEVAPAAPAPKGRKKKAAPVTPAPAAPKKEEAPKPEPKKEGTPKPTSKQERIKELEQEKSTLTTKALKQFPNSPVQLKTRKRIDEINAELDQLKGTEKVQPKKEEVKPAAEEQKVGETKSVLESEVDLKGNFKPDWMRLVDSNLEARVSKVPNKTSRWQFDGGKNGFTYGSKKEVMSILRRGLEQDIYKIKLAIKGGSILRDIENGLMTAQDAKKVIESAGLEVPQNILEKAKTESQKQPTAAETKAKAAPKEEGKPVTEIKNYKGLFNPNKTGVSGIDELLEDDGYQFFYKGIKVERVLMTPDEYLERVRKGLKTKTDANILGAKTDAIKKAIESGAKINAPFISTVGGKFSQEGRNRAVVAKELGEQKIPVFIESDVTFDDKINRGADLVKQSQDNGKKTKADVLEDIKKAGLHRDGVRFIEENYDAIQEQIGGKPSAPEFTSQQESSASQEFDGMKKPSKIKTKSFDGKHGKGAFERMKNITDNFDDIMDGLSEKIKQDCL